jgi:hypothetical protein
MKPRGRRAAWLGGVLIASLLLASAVQVGPAARPAAAWPPYDCEPQWADQTYTQYFNDEYIKYRCAFGEHFRWWWVVEEVGSDDERLDWERYAGAAVWQAVLQSGIGRGYGADDPDDPYDPGVFTVAYELRTPGGTPMPRLLAVRMIIQYQSAGAWYTCSDTGWKQSPRATPQWEYWHEYGPIYGRPKCGEHPYRVKAAGRFLSISTGQWVTNAWTYSRPIGLYSPF